MEKPNRKKLRALMDRFDVKGPVVAKLLDRRVTTIHVYLSRSGADIKDETLVYLEQKLEERAINEQQPTTAG